ncbi:MAG TPA: LuxR C-terminal-related transcriptional regulator [Candidatus Dormibacteraeota bacterium]|nr:LuxR C-terminal-related transcriptional regulator [Candidatus Dormibacteraeota bacterium]
MVAGVVARALGSPDSAGADPTGWLVDYVVREPVLLVWDNCEHLADGCAALAASLLKASDTVQLLCTSRQPLKVPGEKAWVVPSLSFPSSDSAATTVQQYESVRLFVDRAAAVNPNFGLTDANASGIAGICSRLEGIPLAIELAAARANVLAPAQILTMLDDALALLKSDRGLVERQRTLESTLDWSYGLLADVDRVVFRRIGVFAGSFDIDAAVGVCCLAQISFIQLVDALENLIERSLLIADTSSATAKYRMLEPVRHYALKVLKDSGEEAELRRSHLEHYLALARSAEPHLMADPEQPVWLDRLDRQLPDMRAALAWAFTIEPEKGAGLATRLGWFWWFRAYLAEGTTWLRRALAASAEHPSLTAAAVRFEGHLALREGDNRRAAKLGLAALPMYRRLGDESGEAWSLFVLGAAARSLGHFARARVLIAASLRFNERVGNAVRANLVGELAVLSMLAADWKAAEQGFRTALALQRESDDRWSLALTLANWAELRIRQGECALAAPLVLESLEIMRPIDDTFTLVQLLEYAGMITIATGDPIVGLHLMGAAESKRKRLHLQQTEASRGLTESWIKRAERSIGPRAVRKALDKGYEAQFPGFLTMAEEMLATEPKVSGGLSRREWQVAQLIGEGMTNREIADRLFISPRTAEGHVLQILNKLGFQRRAQIATWVSREGISGGTGRKNA